MRGSRRVLALPAALLVAVACADLDVENLNDPDRERALASPGDVETLIAGSFLTWWYTQASFRSMGQPTSTMADQHSSSWGNASMRETSQEPRVWAYNNDPAYGYVYVNEYTWSRAYRALSAIRDGLLSVAGPDGELGTGDDMAIGEGGADTHRAVTWGKFVQGLATYTLAVSYDQAVVVTERTDFEAELVRVPWQQLRDSAVYFLDEAITLANQESFTVPGSWMSFVSIDSDQLIELANFFAARTLAYSPRTEGQRNNVDWNDVLARLNASPTETIILTADDETWWSSILAYCEYPGWSRMDLRTAGVADQAGSWDAWEKETAGLRSPFEIDADDLRFPMYPPEIVPRGEEAACWGQPRSAQCGADGFDIKIEYRDPQRPFRPERGTYHFSGYATLLHNDYWGDWLGPMRWIKQVEIDMLKAEAYIRLNQEASAVPLINATRTTYGGLAAVTGTGKVPYDDAPTNTRCTPRMIVGFPPNPAGAWECGDLWEAMKYEKRIEAFCSSVGIPWFDDRGWGDLISGTITQYPVPAEELMILLEEVYTFGGIPGEIGSAPDIVDWEEGGLRPLRIGEVPSAADLRARVELFERWNAADAAAERRGAQMVRR